MFFGRRATGVRPQASGSVSAECEDGSHLALRAVIGLPAGGRYSNDRKSNLIRSEYRGGLSGLNV